MSIPNALDCCALLRLCCGVVFLFAASGVFAGEQVQITGVDGTLHTGALQDLTRSEVALDDQSPPMPLSSVLEIRFGTRQPRPPGAGSLVLLANDDRLVVKPLRVDEDAVSAAWPLLPASLPVDIPLETVRAVVFDLPHNRELRAELLRSIARIPAGSDRLLLKNGDVLDGQVVTVDENSVLLESSVGEVAADRERVRAVALNPELISFPEAGAVRVLVSLIDGSRVTAHTAELREEGMLEIRPHFGAKVSVPVSTVASLQFFGERIVPLAELEPASFEFTPYLATRWEWQRNRNVGGGPLSLRGREFSTGIGMHSQSRLSYELDGEFTALITTIGIDDSAAGQGSAVFAIEVDGERVFTSEPLTGRDDPLPVPRVDLAGAGRLTLIVEFGPLGDIGDHANWAGAVLIRAE